MKSRYLAGLKHFRSFRFSFYPEDKIKYRLMLTSRRTKQMEELPGEHRMINLSLSGFAFESDQIIDPEHEVRLELCLAKKTYSFEGRLVRGTRHREKSSSFTYGIKLEEDKKQLNERDFIEALVSHFKSKRLRRELINLLVHEVKLGAPQRDEILGILIGLFSDLKAFDDRGEFLEVFMMQTKKMFRCEGVRFYELSAKREFLCPVHPFQVAGRRSFEIQNTIFHSMLTSKKSKFFYSSDEMAGDPYYSTVPSSEGVLTKNLLLCPILNHEQEVVGFLELFNFRKALTKERTLKYDKTVWLSSFLISVLYEKFNVLPDEQGATMKADEPGYKRELFVGESAHIQDTKDFISKTFLHNGPLLIHGPRGTGKTLIAKMVHEQSEKSSMPLGILDVADWREDIDLAEYLIGHNNKVGKFELYAGGTLVLKNIDLLTSEMQLKFLKLFTDHHAIRLMTTSHLCIEDLKKVLLYDFQTFIALGEDNVFETISLSQRREDVLFLSRYFLQKECELNGLIPKKLSREVEAVFMNYSWPGNIRELELAIKRCIWAYQSSHIIHELPTAVAPLFDKNHVQFDAYFNVLNEFHSFLTQNESAILKRHFKQQLALRWLKDCGEDALLARTKLGLSTQQWQEWLEGVEEKVQAA